MTTPDCSPTASEIPAAPACATAALGPEDSGLLCELHRIRLAVAKATAEVRSGRRTALPGGAVFLDDGRVLCRERDRGDSRYPYGADGFNFWVTANGHMHANRGLFFHFLPAHDGDEPSIAFFAGLLRADRETCRAISILPVPFLPSDAEQVVDRYTILGHDAAYFVAQTRELLTALRVFVSSSHPDGPQIHFSLVVLNLTDGPLEAFTSSMINPFCRHQFAETNEDRWFKTVRVKRSGDRSADLPPFEVTTNEDLNRFQSITNYALIRRAIAMQDKDSKERQLSLLHDLESSAWPHPAAVAVQHCTSRLGYVGTPRRGLATAEFLSTGRFRRDIAVTAFNDLAVAGDLLRFVLPERGSFRCDYEFSTPPDEVSHARQAARLLDPNEVDRIPRSVTEQSTAGGDLALWFGPSRATDLNSTILNHFVGFLKKQVAVCAQLKGYMHPAPNSLIGIRDVFQAIEGHLYDQPAEARAKIIEALGFVLTDGRCPRQYSLPANGAPGRADLREFVDQGAWVISAVHTYLCVTGDLAILQESVGYHRASPGDPSALEPADDRDSVLEHLLRIIDFLDQQRDTATGLVRALYGDWNDALDGLGASTQPGQSFGTGVSVMTSLQLYRNCAELLEILKHIAFDHRGEPTARLQRIRDELRAGLLRFAVVSDDVQRRIVHGWGDQMTYFVGSFRDSDGLARDGLTSNAFWALSDMLKADPTLKSDILGALDRLDSPYGLKTFEPGFAPDAPGVGRITKLPLGSAENGAVYIHASTFGIAAQFCMGEARRAWEQIIKILPFSAHHREPSHSPFVMPNSYVENADLNLTGQSMNDWQTGCSNVLLKLLIRYVFGFDPGLINLRIAPAAWRPFETLILEARAQGRRIRVTCSHGGVSHRRVHINGLEVRELVWDENLGVLAASIPYAALRESGLNEIAVIDPIAG